ncbi:MAG: ABC transporter substrate-binding protein [Deltaproteobacteria bacterium]|nr:ABC transporter substrate-binding protein [Deltaproteobacteria bacterium]
MMKKRICFLTIIAFVLIFSGITFAGEISKANPVLKNSPLDMKGPLVLAQASTASSEKDLKPEYGGVFKMIWRRSPPNLGSPTTRGWGYVDGAYPVMSVLMKLQLSGEPLFDHSTLATGIDISPDGKAVTIHLRKAKFHDGTDFNAAAVKYHIENMKYSPVKFSKITSMDIINDQTIRLNLSEWDGTLLENFFVGHGMIASPMAIAKPTTPEKQAKDHTIGTGPFKFVDWERDVFIRYKKFDDYYEKGKPYLDGMEFLYIADPVTARLAFEAGQAHLINGLTAKDGYELRNKGFRVESINMSGPALVGDSANPDSPFANRKVRLAVEYAIDRETIAQTLGYGFYKAVYQSCIWPMGFNPGLEERRFNPEKAKQLLAEAGYPNGFETRIIAEQFENRDALGAIQNYLANVGIRAKLDIGDRGRVSKLNKEGWQNGLLYSVFIGGPVVPSGVQRSLDKKSIRNASALRPPGFQELLNQAIEERNFAKQTELCQKVIKVIYDEVIMIPLWSQPEIAAMHPSLHGIRYYYDVAHPFIWYPADAWLSK